LSKTGEKWKTDQLQVDHGKQIILFKLDKSGKRRSAASRPCKQIVLLDWIKVENADQRHVDHGKQIILLKPDKSGKRRSAARRAWQANQRKKGEKQAEKDCL
jgi:hypothetical protein